ncbi:MAG: GDP-mannose 4,6-dehydratase, partial [Achromobacter sp.]|nr:GDP-mannose 4,6-dehydratase [Achromobacter sp.]
GGSGRSKLDLGYFERGLGVEGTARNWNTVTRLAAIATGMQYSVREFINTAARELGILLAWEGEGLNETATVLFSPVHDIKAGQVIVRVDPRYFRPTEVETLLGDPTKAREKLGWSPRTTFAQLVKEMVESDLKDARRDALVEQNGYEIYAYKE